MGIDYFTISLSPTIFEQSFLDFTSTYNLKITYNLCWKRVFKFIN